MKLDRRLTPATDRVALESLRGTIERPAYTAGRPARLAVPLADLMTAPGGKRDRQVNFGADLTVIDEESGWFFVQSALDGHCGWLRSEAISFDRPTITHRVSVPATHIYSQPDIKQPEIASISLGARVSVAATEGMFFRLETGGYIFAEHITDQPDSDPVKLAESLLGTPYLWGGNSRAGIDCSGLVQAALIACNLPCPSDSDLQRDAFPEAPEIQRGDLLFWPGHVAMAASPELMIHATAWKMSVIWESIPEAIARIDASGDGPFLGIRRPGL